ncbi:MAG: UDP-N-acetylglucosamine 2-epimerase, partial [Armatimonadota bacterium]
MSDATVLSVVGARPQFIKAFPVSRLLRERLSEVLVHTGQHYDFGMSDVFFEEIDIPEPDYNLGVGSANHANQTAEMLSRIDEVVVGLGDVELLEEHVRHPEVVVLAGVNEHLREPLAEQPRDG